MGLELQPDLCSLLIKDVIYHEEAVRQAGAEALSRAVAQYRKQAAEVMSKLTEIYQEKLYVSTLALWDWQAWAAALFSFSHFSFCLSWRCALNPLLLCLRLAQTSVSWTSCYQPLMAPLYGPEGCLRWYRKAVVGQCQFKQFWPQTCFLLIFLPCSSAGGIITLCSIIKWHCRYGWQILCVPILEKAF